MPPQFNIPTPQPIPSATQNVSAGLTNLFQQQANKPNLFAVIDQALQIRRKNEREAMADSLMKDEFEIKKTAARLERIKLKDLLKTNEVSRGESLAKTQKTQAEADLYKQASQGRGSVSKGIDGTIEYTPNDTFNTSDFAEQTKQFEAENPGWTLEYGQAKTDKYGNTTYPPKPVKVGPGEAQKKAISEANISTMAIDSLIKLSESVPDIGELKDSKGIFGKMVGALPPGTEGSVRAFMSEKFSAGRGGFGTGLTKEQDQSLRLYMSQLPAMGGELYKITSGDSGRLSDADLERGKILAWRPDLGESVEIRDLKNNILRESAKERQLAISRGEYTIDKESGAYMTPQVLEKAIARLASVDGVKTVEQDSNLIIPEDAEVGGKLVTEQDIQDTMKANNMTRREVFESLGWL